MIKIFYLGSDFGYHAIVANFNNLAKIIHVDSSDSALQDALLDADALVDASMRVRITDEMVRKALNLKIISCATTGSDHIDRTEIEIF
jgi:D-3-phosphoglycerate dehydrogenase